jgi:hypothetical protein
VMHSRESQEVPGNARKVPVLNYSTDARSAI